MSFLYLAADQIGIQSGGGRVTQEESTALLDFAVEQKEEFLCWGREQLGGAMGEDPWKWDQMAHDALASMAYFGQRLPKLCHIYSGTFSRTVELLKKHGGKVCYTVAAHSIEKSRQAHRELGIDYDSLYPHLVQPELWQRYAGGYFNADLVICPSQHSADVVKQQGCQRVTIIPHGTDIPEETVPPPTKFILGYLGSYFPDKGIIYLLQAWKKISRPDDLLVLGGKDSKAPFVNQILDHLGVTNVVQTGWLDDVSSFYRGISLYIQPSCTEGFGLEVLEAVSHGRAVLCSTGAGAADVVPDTWRFPASNVDDLAEKIYQFRKVDLALAGRVARELSKAYEWPLIRKLYQETWRGLLA